MTEFTDAVENGTAFRVTFEPFAAPFNAEGANSTFMTLEEPPLSSLLSVGDLPSLAVASSSIQASGIPGEVLVLSGTGAHAGARDGESPFQPVVLAQSPPAECTAEDSLGGGLEGGVYQTTARFGITCRDTFGNAFLREPRSEQQVLTLVSTGGALDEPAGSFRLKFRGVSTARLDAGAVDAGIIESALEATGVAGDVSVAEITSAAVDNSGLTGVGLNVTEFVITFETVLGDVEALEIVDEVNGLSELTAAQLSQLEAAYNNDTGLVLGGENSGVFESYEDPLAGLGSDGAAITACDARRVQRIRLTLGDNSTVGLAESNEQVLSGYWRVEFNGYVSRLLRPGISADDSTGEDQPDFVTVPGAQQAAEPLGVGLKQVLESLPGINTVRVTRTELQTRAGAGEAEFAITFLSWDSDASTGFEDQLAAAFSYNTSDAFGPALLHAEGQLLEGPGAAATVEESCARSPLTGTEARQGRISNEFVVRAADDAGSVVIEGDVFHMMAGNGTHAVTYVMPREGTYNIDVSRALPGGLQGSYYNNRFFFGKPAMTRVDTTISFSWPTFVTSTGQDDVSARWTGWLKVPFSENFTFEATVNDAARLVVDGEELFNTLGTKSASAVTLTGSTTSPLVAGRLVPITLEWQEATGAAQVELKYTSASQGLVVIPAERLFYGLEAVTGSPFEIESTGVLPDRPTGTSAALPSGSDNDDTLEVSWAAPVEDGGAAVSSYRVEWHSGRINGTDPVQTIKVSAGATGGYFLVGAPGAATSDVQVAWNAHPAVLESSLEGIEGVGDVEVALENASPREWSVTFLSYPRAVPPALFVSSSGLEGTGATAGVCASESTAAAAAGISCALTDSANGTALASFCETTEPGPCSTSTLVRQGAAAGLSCDSGCPVLSGNALASGLQYTVAGLTAGQQYIVRVSAQNSQGFGLPSVATTDSTLTPLAVPEEPADVQLERNPGASASSSLRVVWLDPADDRGSSTTGYTIQWRAVGAGEGVEPELSMSADQVDAAWSTAASFSADAASFRDTVRRNPGQPDGNEYVITGLSSGVRYAVRVAASNSRGSGAFRGSDPPTEVPRDAAPAPARGDVTLRTREAGGSVDVAASATSLEVSWVPPSGSDASA